MAQKLVLIADNDSTTCHMLEAAMAAQRFRIVSAADYEQMLALAKVEHPHLIITNVGMRRSDGFTAITQLKTDLTTAAIPILAVMAVSSPELQQVAQTVGCDALLITPVTATTLADVANLLIERAALLQARALRSRPAAPSSRDKTADAHTNIAAAETDAARTQSPTHAKTSLPRCRGCGSDAHSTLVRTTRSSMTYRCDACQHTWRRTLKKLTVAQAADDHMASFR